LSHKGRATSDVTFNPEDLPSAYSNQSIHNRLSDYTSMAREVNGPDFDPYTAPIDAEVVMRVGGGKKHGRYYIADSSINPATTPNLSQIRARSTSSSLAICSRPDSTDVRMAALKVISVSSCVP
jgi:hypothetical protein